MVKKPDRWLLARYQLDGIRIGDQVRRDIEYPVITHFREGVFDIIEPYACQIFKINIPGIRYDIGKEIRSVLDDGNLFELLILIGHHQGGDDEDKGKEERGKQGHDDE